MTQLRQAMVDELQRRNYAATTVSYYIRNVEQFARYFKRSPDRLTPTHLRPYQAYLLHPAARRTTIRSDRGGCISSGGPLRSSRCGSWAFAVSRPA